MIQGHQLKSTKNTQPQLIKHSIRFTIRLGEIWKRPTYKSQNVLSTYNTSLRTQEPFILGSNNYGIYQVHRFVDPLHIPGNIPKKNQGSFQ